MAGLAGAASGLFLAVYPAEGSDDTWRYPLSPEGFVAIQVFFGVQHLPLVAGIVALLGTGWLGAGRAGRAGVILGAAGMALLTATEFLAVTARDADLDEFTYLNALYGISTIAVGLGLVLAGVAVSRAGRLRGWHSWIVLALGIWVFVPMTPALMTSYLGARLSISAWMLLFAALGGLLWRTEDGRDQDDRSTPG